MWCFDLKSLIEICFDKVDGYRGRVFYQCAGVFAKCDSMLVLAVYEVKVAECGMKRRFT